MLSWFQQKKENKGRWFHFPLMPLYGAIWQKCSVFKIRKTFRNNVENENKQWIFVPVNTVLKIQTMSRAIFQILSQNTKLRVKVAYTGWQNCAPFGSNYLNSIGLTRHLDCRFWMKILNPFFHLVLCSIFTFMLKFIFKISASEPSAPRFITQNLILKRNKKNVSLNFFLHQIFSKGLWDM